MFRESLTYPTEREGWLKTVLVGGVLVFLGFLLVPLIAVYGYLVAVIRESIDGSAAPPAFEDWGTLLVDGVKAWVIGIVYLLVPVVVGVLTVGGSAGAVATGSSAGAGLGAAGLLGGLTLTAVLSLLFGYVAVAAVVNFAHRGRFGAAFDAGELRAVAFDGDYAVAWLVSIGVFVVAGLVAGIPLVGFVVGPFVSFYGMVVAGRLWAEGYAAAVGTAETEVAA